MLSSLLLFAASASAFVCPPIACPPPHYYLRRAAVVRCFSADDRRGTPGIGGSRLPSAARRLQMYGNGSDDDEEEYIRAKMEAEAASARLQAAERRLRAKAVQKPLGARTLVDTTDAGTLLVEVPPAGLTTSTVMGGAFSAAWFSVVAPATVASGGASALFMLPFWLAGGAVAKTSLLDPARKTSLSIGEFAWEIKQTLPGGVTLSQESGPTEELVGAEVFVSLWTNGVPTFALKLGGRAGATWSLGDGLPEQELEWVAGEVNSQLDRLRRAREDGSGGGGA
jgi:hypothetical protein